MAMRALGVLVVLFFSYAVIHDPIGSARFIGHGWDNIKDALVAIGHFFDTLLKG